MATRAIDATCTNMCQATSSPTASAHASAALIGDTWLTTITSRVARLVEQLLARGPHPEAEGRRATRPRRARTADRPATPPDVGGYLGHRRGRRSCRSRARSSVRRPRPGGRTRRAVSIVRASGLATTRASAGARASPAPPPGAARARTAAGRPARAAGRARSRRSGRDARGPAPGDDNRGPRPATGRRPLARRRSYRAPVPRRLPFHAAPGDRGRPRSCLAGAVPCRPPRARGTRPAARSGAPGARLPGLGVGLARDDRLLAHHGYRPARSTPSTTTATSPTSTSRSASPVRPPRCGPAPARRGSTSSATRWVRSRRATTSSASAAPRTSTRGCRSRA